MWTRVRGSIGGNRSKFHPNPSKFPRFISENDLPDRYNIIRGSPINIVNVNVSSSSAAESNWSTYDIIYNKKRNRLTEDRARDLVYVHSNLRLLENIQLSCELC